MKNILLTGATGQMGWELQRTLATLGTVIACGRKEFDLCQPKQMSELIRRYAPTVIVNAAAYTAVDEAETEPDLAFQVNATAPGLIAEEAKRLNALLVHYSTDYVFDGTLKKPYSETDAPNPVNIYGQSKLAGEKNIQAVGGKHLILRTSWVYGWHGQNFLLSILKLAEAKNELKIVSDQFGSPTWSQMLAVCTTQLLSIIVYRGIPKELCGLYHLTSSGQTSRYDFVQAILKDHHSKPILMAIPSKDFPRTAKRPLYSVLSNDKLIKAFKIAMPPWELALSLCLNRP